LVFSALAYPRSLQPEKLSQEQLAGQWRRLCYSGEKLKHPGHGCGRKARAWMPLCPASIRLMWPSILSKPWGWQVPGFSAVHLFPDHKQLQLSFPLLCIIPLPHLPQSKHSPKTVVKQKLHPLALSSSPSQQPGKPSEHNPQTSSLLSLCTRWSHFWKQIAIKHSFWSQNETDLTKSLSQSWF
jgi:hypothetical protein